MCEFTKFGVTVSIPYCDNAVYDMIAEFNGKLNKIQVKFCGGYVINGSVSCSCYSTKNPLTNPHKEGYNGEIDYFAFYILAFDCCILVPIDYIGDRKTIRVRMSESKNNQQWNTTVASDFYFDKTIKSYTNIDNVSVKTKVNRCIDCGAEISTSSIRCVACSCNKKRIDIPVTRAELKDMVRDKPFTVIASNFNVTDNCVKNWCKRYSIPFRKLDINSYSDEEWDII